MSKFTFNMEINSKASLKTGLYSIMIRINTKDALPKRVTTSFAIANLKDFNGKANEIRSSNKDANKINGDINRWIRKAQTFIEEHNREQEENRDFKKTLYINEVRDYLHELINGSTQLVHGEKGDFVAFIKNKLKERKLKPNTGDTGICAVNRFEEFLKEKKFPEKFPIASITADFLHQYSEYLRNKRGNSNGTIKNRIACLCTYYNIAIKIGLVKIKEPTKNPFHGLGLKVKRTKKHSLTKEEFESLMNINKLSKIQTKVLHSWLFAYCTHGMRIADILQLRNQNIVNGERVVYSMGKTNKYKSIRLTPLAIEIVSIYYKPDLPDKFLFYHLDGLENEKDLVLLTKKIKLATNCINLVLERLKTKAGLTNKLTTHVARHTMAEHTWRKLKDSRLVQELLGHSNAKTTRAYLEDIDPDILDDAMEIVQQGHSLYKKEEE